jgi:hypothetical protein
MRCSKWDLAFPLELATDLSVQNLLVAFDAQQEVGPLLREPGSALGLSSGALPFQGAESS